jgi:hypothetical protein
MTTPVQMKWPDTLAAGAAAAAHAAGYLREAMARLAPGAGPEVTQALTFVAETTSSFAACIDGIAQADPNAATWVRGPRHLGPGWELQQAASAVSTAARALRDADGRAAGRGAARLRGLLRRLPALPPADGIRPGLLLEARHAATAAAFLEKILIPGYLARHDPIRGPDGATDSLSSSAGILRQISDATDSLAWCVSSVSLPAGDWHVRSALNSAARSLWTAAAELRIASADVHRPARPEPADPARSPGPALPATAARAPQAGTPEFTAQVPAVPTTPASSNRMLKEVLRAGNGGVLVARLARAGMRGPAQPQPAVPRRRAAGQARGTNPATPRSRR